MVKRLLSLWSGACAVAVVALAMPVHAQALCPVTPAPVNGCSTQYFEYLSPRIALFKDLFTGSCNTHDVCYGELGSNADSCDNAFLSNMRGTCDNRFNRWLQPAEWTECRSAAQDYYSGVRLGAYITSFDGWPDCQTRAVNNSVLISGYVNLNSCVTTPQRTAIYSASFLQRLDTIFTTAIARPPSPFEFFASVHAASPTGDPGIYDAAVANYAGTRAGLTPPRLSWSFTFVNSPTFTAATPDGAVSFRWLLNNKSLTGTTVSIPARNPKYTTTYKATGYLLGTNGKGVRNLVLVDQSWSEKGWCGNTPGVPCD